MGKPSPQIEENLLQRLFVHHETHMKPPGAENEAPRKKNPSSTGLSYGMDVQLHVLHRIHFENSGRQVNKSLLNNHEIVSSSTEQRLDLSPMNEEKCLLTASPLTSKVTDLRVKSRRLIEID
jgi:hypothetical protein